MKMLRVSYVNDSTGHVFEQMPEQLAMLCQAQKMQPVLPSSTQQQQQQPQQSYNSYQQQFQQPYQQ